MSDNEGWSLLDGTQMRWSLLTAWRKFQDMAQAKWGEARQSPTIFIIPELELGMSGMPTEIKSESRVQTGRGSRERESQRSAERISGAFNWILIRARI